MLRWFQARYSRPLIGALIAATLSVLLAIGGVIWVEQERQLGLRLALAQAETSRLAGMLNVMVARADQALIGLALAPGLATQPDCDARLGRAADSFPGTVAALAFVDAGGIVTCSSLPTLRGTRNLTEMPFQSGTDGAPMVSFIVLGSSTREPLVVIQRPAPGGGIVEAGLRVEALRLVTAAPPRSSLEDSRGTRVALSDGRVTTGLPAAYFPPAPAAAAVALPTGPRIVARIGDDLAVTFDPERATPADARAAALIRTGWLFLVLAGGVAAILVVLRLTLLRPLRRLGEELDGKAGTEALTDWLSEHPDSPMRHVAERILARELNQQQRLALREAMLREVNHRVAGHLQMVASLLRLQARERGPAMVNDALRRAEHRVNTVALVHQGLQQARRGDDLDLLDLLRRVAVNLVEGSPLADAVTLHIEGDDLIVPSETGVAVALMVNEWITTVLQDETPPQSIFVGIWARDGDGVLEYDDGCGRHDGLEHAGLSLSIVEALCAQIGGDRERRRGRGWRLTFPLAAGADA